MKNRIATFLILALMVCNTYPTNAKVVWGEYVTKQEVVDYLASLSEILEKAIDIDTLTPKIERNPTAKYIRDENMKRAEQERGN